MEEIQAILYGEKRPYIPDSRGDDYYLPLFRGLVLVQAEFIPHYAVSFPVPVFSGRVRYYKRLIDNAIVADLNDLFAHLQNGGTDLILFYRKKLYEEIASYLCQIDKYIRQYDYDLKALTLPTADFSKNVQHAECTYIFYYMAVALICMYMEFQGRFIECIEPDKQCEIADFYMQVLKRHVPENIYIQKIAPAEWETVAAESNLILSAKGVQAVLSFVYLKLDKEGGNMADLMDALKRMGCIAVDTSIVDFRHAFSGVEVSNPIRWTGTKSELSYLIRLLCNTHKVLQYNGSLWRTVCACFVDSAGNTFDANNLRDQKKPKLAAEAIEKAAALMR